MIGVDRAREERSLRESWVNRGWGIAVTGLVAFMVIFNVTFAVLPSPSTLGAVIRVGTLALPWFGVAAFRRFAAENAGPLLAVLALVGYGFLQWTLTGFADSSQTIRLFAFVLYAIYGSLLLATLFEGDGRAFARACTIAGVVQGILIIYSFVSPSYRAWLSGIVQQSGNIDIVTGFGAPGFSNSAGALLSVAQAGCVFAALYGARLASRRSTRIAYVVAALIIASATVFAGRTGLILASAFITVFGVDALRRRQWDVIGTVMMTVVALVLIGNVALQLMADHAGADVEFLKSWALELFQRGTQSASYGDLQSQPVPPVSFRTVIGTGLVSASPPWVGNASGNDSGYIQTYYALGLGASVLFYGTVALLAVRAALRSSAPILFGALAVAMFAIEAKEPFMFKAPLPLIFFTLTFMRFARTEPSHDHPYAQ